MKIATMFKPLALAAAIAIPGLVNAASYSLPIDQSGSYSVTASTFEDTFNFHVGSLSNLTGGAASSPFTISFSLPVVGTVNVPVSALSFTGLSLWNGTTQVLSGFSVSGLNTSSLSFAGNSLAAGDYSLKLTGYAPSNTGAYAVYANLAPVPESESFAMFLAGLCVMGAVARRRSKKL